MDVNDDGDIFLSTYFIWHSKFIYTLLLRLIIMGTLFGLVLQVIQLFNPQYIHDEAWGIKATNDGGCVVIAGTGDEYEEYSEW